ncbi:hypothetical protein BSF44_56920 [Pseudomonas sp. ACN8]|nr:hypothetical protein BSF44_56920 [Pseudomonas sp. ACN8]
MVIDRQTGRVGQGHGVSHRTTFAHGGFVRSQGRDDFADGVGDGHVGRRAVDHQVFEGFAVNRCIADANREGLTVLVDVVALHRCGVDGRQFARFNGDGAAIAQGDLEVVIEFLVDLDGEGRREVFLHAAVAFDADGDLVALVVARGARARFVGDGGFDCGLAQGQFFEVVCASDRFQFVDDRCLAAGEHVVGRGDGCCAGRGVGRDGDLGAVGEGEL